MANLTATYGYASEGESFSIADPNEVWLMEMVGKGSIELGSIWVATRIPDGYVCAHANQVLVLLTIQLDLRVFFSLTLDRRRQSQSES